MLKDRYDLEVSTTSVQACDLYIDTIDRMLAADEGIVDALNATLQADPEFALAHAAQAREHQLHGRIKEARASAETAMELGARTTRRERQHIEIIQHLVSGQMPKSLELTREHLKDFPRDAFVMNPACGVFGIIGFSGRVGREAEHLDFVEPFAEHYGDDWWFLTVHAFALLEMGQWKRARQLVERALEQRPRSAHGAHTLTHALFESGDDQEALAFLSDWLTSLDRGSMLHCHLWWHQALLLLMTGDHDAAFKALSENCLPGTTKSPSINVFTDSVAFLWRAELAGAPRQVEIWETLLQYYTAQFRRPIVFVDAHIGFVYAALGQTEQMNACISELQELGETGQLPAGTTAASLTRAYQAFAAQDWAKAIELFEPVMSQLVRIGGSRAQRDLQTNTLLAAYVNDGRLDEATEFLGKFHDRQPSRPIAGLTA
ncbi:MAG: tetratricopeptide repeat protein [Pseudomonadota bacterium]